MDARERERLGGKRVKAVVRDGVQGTGSAVFEGFEAGIFGIGIGKFPVLDRDRLPVKISRIFCGAT